MVGSMEVSVLWWLLVLGDRLAEVEWIVMYWSTIDVTFSLLLASELRQLWVNQSTSGLIDTVLASVDMGNILSHRWEMNEIDYYFYGRLSGKEYKV